MIIKTASSAKKKFDIMYVMQSEVCCEIVYVACEPYSVYAAEKGGVRRLQIDVYQLQAVTW